MRKPRIKRAAAFLNFVCMLKLCCGSVQLGTLNSTDESLWRAIKNERANHVRMNTLQNNDQKKEASRIGYRISSYSFLP